MVGRFKFKGRLAALYEGFNTRSHVKFHGTLQWHHNGRDCVSNRQPHHYLLHRLFKRRSKKTRKLRVTGLCAGNSSVTGEFPAQMASNTENVSIWWRHHDLVGHFVWRHAVHKVDSQSPIAKNTHLWSALCLLMVKHRYVLGHLPALGYDSVYIWDRYWSD